MTTLTAADLIYNPIFDTDSYKPSHYLQLPDGVQYAESYIEARSGGDEIVVFGWNMILESLKTKITKEMVDEAEEMWNEHCGSFNRKGWMDIVEKYDGYIPISLIGVPEGTVVGTKKVIAVARVHAPFIWCLGWLETLLLRIWYPITVATISRQCKGIIKHAMEKTCDNLDGLPLKLHDFGSRGVSSPQSAMIGGLAHMLNFKGSDTGIAIRAARYFYNEKMPAYSIPASEHGTMTPWINMSNGGEVKAYRNMIKQFGDKPIFACVSDSIDIENAVANVWGTELKDEVMAMNATLVIRPDSGDPIEWLPKLLTIMADKFGYTTNTKGYKLINKVRLIQGDGVTVETLPLMIKAIVEAGFSLDNVSFGMGGGLLQHVNRDTFGFAMKVCFMDINGEQVYVFKSPKTDQGKKSKSGMLRLYRSRVTGEFIEVDISKVPEVDSEFEYMFQNLYQLHVKVVKADTVKYVPKFARPATLSEISARVKSV